MKHALPITTFAKRWAILLFVIVWGLVGQVGLGQENDALNRLTIQNNSGQFALIKTVGPTRSVTKIPLDQKKTIHLAPGEYYILVRFGFAPKEYIYTKGEAFTVKQEKEKFSLITITLHRIVSGMENDREVSGEEFENFTMGNETQSTEGEKTPNAKE